MGVLGKITITSSKDIKKSELQKADTIIVASDVSEEIVKTLRSQINEPGKIILRLKKNDKKGSHYNKQLAVLLRSTPVILNESDSSFLVKVAHTGMSANEIKDNIVSVFQRINIGGRFRGGWSAIKRVNLKTGTSRAVLIYEDTDMQIKMSNNMKRRAENAKGWGPKKAKLDSGVSPSRKETGTKADSPNLKRKLEDAVQLNRTASISPKKLEKKEKKAKTSGQNLSGIAIPKPAALANGSSPKDQEAGPLKRNKKQQRGKEQVQGKDEEQSPESKDLLSMLINQAKMSVLSPAEEAAEIATAPDQRSKKNKKKQGGAKNLVSVQKDGELSDEFKMNMLERLQLFTRGTELEDIIVAPLKAEKNPNGKDEGLAKKTAEVMPASTGSPKKKKNKKSLTAVNSPASLTNGSVQGKAEGGSPGKNTPKKKKNKKTPQKVNVVAPVANENLSVTANVKSVANGSDGKSTSKVNKTPKKVNLRSILAHGIVTEKAQVTKVVALESPGSKLKKKKKKNKSPKKAKVAAL